MNIQSRPLTDDFKFNGEGGFAGVVLEQKAVRSGVRPLDFGQRQ